MTARTTLSGWQGLPPPRTALQLGNAPVLLPLPPTTDVTHLDAAAIATAQLSQRFELVIVAGQLLRGDDGRRRAVLHTAVQHLDRAGRLAVVHPDGESPDHEELAALDLLPTGRQPAGEAIASCFRRGSRTTVHDMVFEARSNLRRLTPAELHHQLQSGRPPLVLDTRTPSDRARFGTVVGAIHLPRTVLEWRLDPANGYLHPAIIGFQQHLVVVCNHGYSSSVAAVSVQRLGYRHVTDLVGGMQAWRAAGLPVVPPNHTFLEL